MAEHALLEAQSCSRSASEALLEAQSCSCSASEAHTPSHSAHSPSRSASEALLEALTPSNSAAGLEARTHPAARFSGGCSDRASYDSASFTDELSTGEALMADSQWMLADSAAVVLLVLATLLAQGPKFEFTPNSIYPDMEAWVTRRSPDCPI